MNVVTGSGAEVGNAIVDHPDIRVISFTGHTDTGVEISTPRGEDAQAGLASSWAARTRS